MAYEKKPNYPSYKKPGVYPPGSTKELGLNNDDLEKFSLGNWNSILRSNRVFLNKSIAIDDNVQNNEPSILTNIPLYLTSPFYHRPTGPNGVLASFRSVFYRFFAQVYGYYNNDGDFSPEPQDGYTPVMWNKEIYTDGFNTAPPYVLSYGDLNLDEYPVSMGGQENPNRIGEPSTTVSYLAFKFNDQNSDYNEVGQSDDDVRNFMLARQEELYNFLRVNPFFIEENPIENDEAYGSLTDGNPIKLKFDENSQSQLNEILNNTLTRVVKLRGSENQILPIIANLRLNIMFDRPKVDYLGNEIPKDRITNEYVFGLANNDGYIEPSYSTFHPLTIGDATTLAENVENGNFNDVSELYSYPAFLIDDKDDGNFFNAYIPNLLNEEFPSIGSPNSNDYNNRLTYLQTLGHPNYVIGEELENSPAPEQLIISSLGESEDITNFVNTVTYDIVDFEVKCKRSINDEILKDLSDNNDFLNYDFEDERYEQSSYPIKIDLTIDLFGAPNFINEKMDVDLSSYANADSRDDYIINQIQTASTSSLAYYRYQVVQWGDEKKTLEDDSFLQTPFFSMYEMNDYPPIEEFNYKVNKAEQTNNSKAIITVNDDGQHVYNKTSHVYNTPGLKSIKIIVYRYTNDGLILLSTTLVNKNILITDGALKSQDFSILGGTDFNFLPIKDNQAIIGGLDEDSNYNNSVSKIVKDDNFVQEDYLERVSSKDYIRKFNNGLLGKTPGQLDLSQTRVFTESRDIYDFIGGDKLEWINNGSGSLPLNSLATDIFIRDEKCVVDLNPANSEFLTIQNQMGTKEQGILVGDYKVNQPKDSRVQKQGVMQTPLLETNNDKQAF